uniref:tRNA (34-2'-O)-methyltransferase regulator WDR6 n=1 Tax=Echeneis naucrates TaxID=173247 RepID=A0A665T0T7_ECHNA
KASASLCVLQHYRIHGIRPRHRAPVPDQKPRFYDLAVFGSKAVRLVRLHVSLQDGSGLHLETLGPLMELKDWVLDACWLSEDKHSILCVAVAHNSALLLDVNTGTVLVQRSCLEGCLLYSALLLVHELWDDAVLVGGTVFNQLVLWKPGGGQEGDSECKAPVERRLLGHSGVIFSISYLQEKGWLASASDDRSVRVWGVGALGGPGGKCGDLNPTCLRVLYGHQARVFSVCLSPGKVFSAGEDGACLVWDWTGGGKVIQTLKGHRAGGVRALAVSKGTGDEERWVATGGADGGVRLWRLKENEERKMEEVGSERLTDLKFPGDSIPKVVCGAEEDGNEGWSQSKFVVCTDQGTVYQYSNGQWEILWQGTPDFQSYCVMETVSIKAKDSAAKFNLCAVGNLSGSIHVFPICHPQSAILLTAGLGKIHSLIWQEGGGGMCLLASGAEGLVYRWCIEIKSNEICSLTFNVNPLPPFLLPPCTKRWLLAAVFLHSRSQEALWVCGDRRGSLLLFQEMGKLVQQKLDGVQVDVGNKNESDGDGRSSIMEERENKEVQTLKLQPLCSLFGVHGKQGVTSVYEHQGLLYSTGRDGCVRIFRVLRVQRACKGMEWLERAREARFVIAGFHAVHFMIWDPVRQERLLAVPCGGGHRSWILWPSDKGVWPGYGALVFIKHRAVLASQPTGGGPGSTGRTGGWGLREGVHGRGIGCVCRLGRIEGSRNGINTIRNKTESERGEMEREGGHWEVVVTGGEDTSLTILALHPDSGNMEVLSVITDHISSVRTVTAVTHPEGEGVNRSQSLNALVVSAGGRAQMQCYRLSIGWDKQRPVPSCQVIQVASHRLDKQWERRRNRHKTVKMDPETRQVQGCDDGGIGTKLSKGQIDLLWETFYHQRCVLSVATCNLEDGKGNRYKLLFTAATDGKIAVWDLTDVCSSTDASTPPIPCLNIPAHQSGINSLAVWAEKLVHQEGGCLVTVASGGDDGQLKVSVIKAHFSEDGKTGDSRDFSHICESTISSTMAIQAADQLHLHLHASFHIPGAHAAPL